MPRRLTELEESKAGDEWQEHRPEVGEGALQATERALSFIPAVQGTSAGLRPALGKD